MPPGRPTEYKPEYAREAEKLCMLGATDIQLADFFEVSERTLNTWKHVHPEFLQSLKVAKEEADTAVVRSLYRKALGYEFDSVKVFCTDGRVTEVPYREIVPPSDTACIFWLKNRKSQEWRDKIENMHTGEIGIKQVLVPDRINTQPSAKDVKPEF